MQLFFWLFMSCIFVVLYLQWSIWLTKDHVRHLLETLCLGTLIICLSAYLFFAWWDMITLVTDFSSGVCSIIRKVHPIYWSERNFVFIPGCWFLYLASMRTFFVFQFPLFMNDYSLFVDMFSCMEMFTCLLMERNLQISGKISLTSCHLNHENKIMRCDSPLDFLMQTKLLKQERRTLSPKLPLYTT